MNIDTHPCFNPKACKSHGRVHLPVAPRCNIQCNFCNRKFDCVNESRPGVSSSILNPLQAMAYLDKVMGAKKNISVVGIAGPGDPFANPDETLTTLKMVRRKYPDMLLCVATNGLNLPDYLDDLAELKVSHVSITINAVDPRIGEGIYSWVRFGKKSLPPSKGAALILEKQMESVNGLKGRGIIVKVNTIVLPGINDHHVIDIAREMAKHHVDLLNCMPYYPNEGSNFSHLKEPSAQSISKIQSDAKKHIPQMLHCKRCRADAVGMLDEQPNMELMDSLRECASQRHPYENEFVFQQKQHEKKHASGQTQHGKNNVSQQNRHQNNSSLFSEHSFVAVATREGVLVNQHLGEAKELNIYDIRNERPQLVDRRELPQPGGMDLRWHTIADILKDCHHILVSGIGDAPRRVLTERGFNVLTVNGLIPEVIHAVKHEDDITHLLKREPSLCMAECSGSGMGCM
ncbi:NifB2 [Desulfamplus magnetovallimortis]|uniref:FeMo cofactor biosynthesis protein NifB n=1 Tax=Desulfamplus magnetovallimortis TaxID=1246637 RepID=A0A1W1HGZ0_9BACT|nr:nitrogenase cofactor biosynthesis protein NifB [Desulfamplus magnetovallimortis]SLM31675.1 NifB2 [Desulfamplus magnetovallimortis]